MGGGSAVLLLCLAVLAPCVLAQPVISIQNNRLFLDNVEFIIKGVAYSPSPIGQEQMQSSGYGGAGLCSSKITPWNEWKSACYDSDYYDGSPDPYTPSRFPTGFMPLWQRDFQQITSLGLNTIRLYNTNPSTLPVTKLYTNLYKVPSGKDHVPFIKYCEQMNVKVIYALFSDEPSYINLDEGVFRRYLRWQIDEVGNSSAVIMWQIGNEMTTYWQGRSNNWNATAYTLKINRMIAYIRTYTKTRWNRFIPVTSTIVNIGTMYNYLYQNWDVDVFTSNVFTTSFDSQFAASSNNDGIAALACRYNKPFLMTETGPTWKPGTAYTAGVLNQIWYSVMKNIPNSLLGAVWFEFTDEPAKGKDFGLFNVSVTRLSNGSRSDQVDVFVADTLVKKQQWYDAYSGTYNSQQYNYRADVFKTLLKRNPYNALTNNPDTCASTFTLKPCPGSSTQGKCSGNGYCDRKYGTCTCLPGWSGTSCTVASCSCNGRGVCSTAVYPIECVCNAGYYGPACEHAVVPSVCPVYNGTNCTNGNGNCAAGTCYCYPGWTGVDCRVTDPGFGSANVQQFWVGCLQSAVFPVTAPAATTLTNQKCRYYCSLRGYPYASTTNGNTCQCGTSVSTQTTSISCTSNCGGDANQRCGGTSQQSVYLAGRAWDTGYRGCFPDNATRDLPVQMDSGSGSVDTCRKACFDANYAYSSVQNGAQCFCGNFYGQMGAQLSDSDCSMPCANDNTVMCGAAWVNSVYNSWLPAGYQLY